MVATAGISALFPAASLCADPNAKLSKLRGGSTNLGGFKSKSVSSVSFQVKASAEAPPKINGTSTGLQLGRVEIEDTITSPPPNTFAKQLSDWSTLLASISTMFMATGKQLPKIHSKPRPSDMFIDPYHLGGVVGDTLVFRQNFPIRSYEIGADGLASIETLMNHLQEVSLSHCRNAGLLNNGFGSTPEMTKRNLIWVVTKMQVLIDRYPSRGDVVQVDSWVGPAGKNGMSRDWILRDRKSGEILAKATSVWVMMNKATRRLSKLPDAVRLELLPIFMDTAPVVDVDCRKLTKLNDDTADYIIKGISPRWADLDVNKHVNNVEYVTWIVESAPPAILETHELSSMTIEYRRECGKDNVMQSLSTISGIDNADFLVSGNLECEHTLRLEEGDEVMRGRTEWRTKPIKICGNS